MWHCAYDCTYRKACWIRDFRARDIGGLRANRNSSKSRFPLPSASISEYMSWISVGSRSTLNGFISILIHFINSRFGDWIAPDHTYPVTAVSHPWINLENHKSLLNHKNVRLWWNSLDVLSPWDLYKCSWII